MAVLGREGGGFEVAQVVQVFFSLWLLYSVGNLHLKLLDEIAFSN